MATRRTLRELYRMRSISCPSPPLASFAMSPPQKRNWSGVHEKRTKIRIKGLFAASLDNEGRNIAEEAPIAASLDNEERPKASIAAEEMPFAPLAWRSSMCRAAEIGARGAEPAEAPAAPAAEPAEIAAFGQWSIAEEAAIAAASGAASAAVPQEEGKPPSRWALKVDQLPMAPRGSRTALLAATERRAEVVLQRPGAWRECSFCGWARKVPAAGSRQLHCLSPSAGFKGPWRCGAQLAMAGWGLCTEIPEDAVEDHNSIVKSALEAVQGAMVPPAQNADRQRFLRAVREKVVELCGNRADEH